MEIISPSNAVHGGGRGSGPPFLGHDVGFLTLGPKLDPLLDPPFLAPLTFVRRSLSNTDLSGGIGQIFQIATSPTFPFSFS